MPASLELTSPQRRRLLKALAATGVLAAVERNVALAQTAPDYKALVGILLWGGNDGENTLVRYDAAGYQNYAAIRSPASGLNIPQAQLLPVQPARVATPFGFHPSCGPFKALFDARKLAVIANMGMLAQPSTKAGLETQGQPRPANLFSHSDQQFSMQTADHAQLRKTGWGGRIADRLDAVNAGNLFPALTSTAGLKSFVAGATSIPLTVSGGGYQGAMGTSSFQFDALREAGLREILGETSRNTYEIAAQLLAEEGLASTSVIKPIFDSTASVVKPFFDGMNNGIAGQLRTIAQMIEGRGQIGLRRQVFFAQQGDYDTHAQQPGRHPQLLADLSKAMYAFVDAMAAIGMGDKVTTFTISDFGRTFKPATGQGTDHGWGNYAFVAGGAVNGGDIYGTLPVQSLGGPDDFGKDGRWIPTTSLEQFAAPMLRWYGMSEGDLSYVLPNIGAFPSTNLGFMA
jgi:uncharacterized protein (DUF1501 family)